MSTKRIPPRKQSTRGSIRWSAKNADKIVDLFMPYVRYTDKSFVFSAELGHPYINATEMVVNWTLPKPNDHRIIFEDYVALTVEFYAAVESRRKEK